MPELSKQRPQAQDKPLGSKREKVLTLSSFNFNAASHLKGPFIFQNSFTVLTSLDPHKCRIDRPTNVFLFFIVVVVIADTYIALTM